MNAATPSLIDDCFLHDKDRLRHDEALKLLQQRLSVIVATETVSTDQALGRVLAQDIGAPHKVPLHTNAAVDGYAFDSADFDGSPMPVSARIAAGDLAPEPLQPGTAVRIFTGAVMPAGAQTVAMQEDCSESDGRVQLPTGLKSGANCRKSGEDLQPGDLVVAKGKRIGAADLAALASIGIADVSVFKKLKVALYSNGNEMRVPGASDTALLPGEVYDANQPLLAALCANLPVELSRLGIIRDDAKAAEEAIAAARQEHDVIITTGGASRGAEDHMVTVLDKLGKRHLWQLAVKPGRPMMFGQLTRADSPQPCLYFGLPGNPVAAMVCFLLYTQPALLRLAGADWQTPPRFKVPAAFSIAKKKPDRREFIRGKLVSGENGELFADKYGRDGSGLISSLRESDGLIEIPEEVISLEQGELVSFLPFSGF
ncbi:MAG: molybdopterin molybdotransferase MoeA [Hyphomicrobiales bacterium]|nr:molybdopterin molybdotransferase MoeA [Hyphomicrobiales bacterium]